MDKNLTIPKKIHYCWFGGNPLPESARKCIESWKKYLPDYEIKQWNEDNFDVFSSRYSAQAYNAKKYAFVSDYARFKILYEEGGLYFDTDVELIKNPDFIISKGPFMGCERNAAVATTPLELSVAPGLGLGAFPRMGIYKEIIDKYEHSEFIDRAGKPNTSETVVFITTKILQKHGLKLTPEIQECAGLLIYPNDYFSPKDVDTKKTTITPNTVSIHHYDGTWAEWYDKAAGERGPKLKKLFGNKLGHKMNLYIYLLQKYGLVRLTKKIFHRT